MTYSTTFDTLIGTAASYWQINRANYVVGDEREVQFIRAMAVLEGLRLCLPGTRLQLIPLFLAERERSVHKVRTEAAAMTADTVFKIDLSAELAEQTHGPDADDEDGEGESDEMKVVKYRICGVGDGKMSRWAMLRGMFQTSILLTLLMASIGARNDLDKEKPLCLSMENAFTQRQFTSEKGAITSFASIDSSNNFREWLMRVFPDVLFGYSSETRERLASASDIALVDNTFPAVVAGHTVLLGGLRMLQWRGDVYESARCRTSPWVSDGSAPYVSDAFTSMINPARLGVADGATLRGQALLDAIEQGMTEPVSFGNVTKCYYSADRTTLPFGPMRPNMTDAEISNERFGSSSVGMVDMPSADCKPACLAVQYDGVLGAFVYQSAEALGLPYSLITSSYLPGGYAITLPGNVTRAQYTDIVTRVLGDAQNSARWFDRQTRSVHINMLMYNLQHHLVADVHLEVEFDPSGSIASKVSCGAISVEEINYSKLVPECMLTVWLVGRGLAILSSLCFKKRPAPGEKPVRILITVELVVHVFTTVFGLLGSYYRFIFLTQQLDFRASFRDGAPWPPPYMTNFGAVIDMLRNSVTMYAWALLTCTMRFALYYSIISKRLYILRLTISRATYRLIPTLLLLCVSLASFAIGGNQLYFTTTYEWQDLPNSFGTVLYLLRRPMGMNWDRMRQSPTIWPFEWDEPSPVTITFLLSFTCVTIWIMANLYRAVIIIEYATVIQIYEKRPPGDLTSDPWPSFNPLIWWNKQRASWKESAYTQRIRHKQKTEWSILERRQMAKQKALVERMKRDHSDVKCESEVSDTTY